MLGEQQALHVCVGDGLALLIAATLEAGGHGQASRSGGSSDQALGEVEAAQGHAGPVDADEAEEAVLDWVPFRAAGWIMADGHLQPESVTQLLLDLRLPDPRAAAVRA